MKEKLTKNLGIKILSLILASILWLVVVNIDDPVGTRTLRDIVVEVQHQEAIKSLGKVYEIVEGSTVDVTVRAKRSVLDQVRDSDIRAVADLSNLSYTNAVDIKVSCTKPVESLTMGRVSTLKVSLEDIDSKQVKISVVQKGTEEVGYSVGSIKAKPNIIQVTGAKSQIARIDQVKVEIDVSNASADFTAEGEPRAYDADGRVIDSNNLIFSANKITLSATILKTKKVNLNIQAVGTPLEGHEFVGIEYEPKEITIAGDTSILNDISSIPIQIDINNAFLSIEEEIDLINYLPEGTFIAEDNKTVMVNVIIEEIQEKTLTFNTDQVEIKNLPTGTTFHFNQDEELSIVISGLSDTLRDVTIENLNPYIDLKGKKLGVHQVEMIFQTIEGVTIKESPILGITLKDGSDSSIPENGGIVVPDETNEE